jgi:hypothetical protein
MKPEVPVETEKKQASAPPIVRYFEKIKIKKGGKTLNSNANA